MGISQISNSAVGKHLSLKRIAHLEKKERTLEGFTVIHRGFSKVSETVETESAAHIQSSLILLFHVIRKD